MDLVSEQAFVVWKWFRLTCPRLSPLLLCRSKDYKKSGDKHVPLASQHKVNKQPGAQPSASQHMVNNTTWGAQLCFLSVGGIVILSVREQVYLNTKSPIALLVPLSFTSLPPSLSLPPPLTPPFPHTKSNASGFQAPTSPPLLL